MVERKNVRERTLCAFVEGQLVWVYALYEAAKGCYGRVMESTAGGSVRVRYGGVEFVFVPQTLKKQSMFGEATHQTKLPSGGVRYMRADYRCPLCHATVFSVHQSDCEKFCGTVQMEHVRYRPL